MDITANLTFNKVTHIKDTDAHLVISLTAPAVEDRNKRAPLCLIPLIDVSPSMNGVKLAYAKRSLVKMIEHLSPKDYCGLVRFSSDARTIMDPVLCTTEAKEELKRKVNELTTSGGTNIASAMLEGLRVANNMDLSAEVITRVILFTDGMANTGPAITPKDMLELVKPNVGLASISAFGYGMDAQQEFLLDLAKSGNGNYSFVENPDDALSAFGQELGGLLTTCATNFTIEIEPLAGHSVTKVVTDVDAEEEALGEVSITFPDMVSEETRHLVLAVKLQAQKNAFPRDVNVFNIRVNYDVLDQSLRLEHKSVELKAKVQFVKDGEQDKTATAELDKVVGLAQMVRAQLEAEEHAKSGNYSAAAATMDFMSSDFSSRGLVGLGQIATNLSNSVHDGNSYRRSRAYRTSVVRGATRGVGGSYDSTAAQELMSLGVSLSTSSQDNTTLSFHDTTTVGGADQVPADLAQIVGSQPDDGFNITDFDLTGVDWTIQPSITVQPAIQGQPTWTMNPLTTPLNPHTLIGPHTTGYVTTVPATQTITTITIPEQTVPAPVEPEAKKAPKRRISQKSKRW